MIPCMCLILRLEMARLQRELYILKANPSACADDQEGSVCYIFDTNLTAAFG